MAEELKQFKEKLDATEDIEEVLQILDQLKSVKVTLELLKVSQLGLSVGNLKKKFTDKRIVEQSKQLVTDWKAACVPAAATPDKSQNGKTPTKKVEEKKEVKKEEIKKEEPAVDKKRKLSNTVEEKKTTPNKKLAPTPTPPKLSEAGSDRDRARILLTEALTGPEVEEGGQWDPSDAATTVEAELLTIYGSTNKDYKAKLRSLSFNLKKNPALRKDLLGGDLSVEKLCRMTSAEMANEEEQKKRREIEKWHMEAATIGKMEASTDQFLCGKCKNRKCTYYQLQTRSADEPMTTFVTCTVCNNRWKFC
jgi:transcription elongation factor S-II